MPSYACYAKSIPLQLRSSIPGFRPRELDQCLEPKHQQVQYDTLVVRRHGREVRDAIRPGEWYELQDIAQDSDDEGFFTAKKWADRLASVPPTPTDLLGSHRLGIAEAQPLAKISP